MDNFNGFTVCFVIKIDDLFESSYFYWIIQIYNDNKQVAMNNIKTPILLEPDSAKVCECS